MAAVAMICWDFGRRFGFLTYAEDPVDEVE